MRYRTLTLEGNEFDTVLLHMGVKKIIKLGSIINTISKDIMNTVVNHYKNFGVKPIIIARVAFAKQLNATFHCVKSIQVWSFFWTVFSRIWALFSQCLFTTLSHFRPMLHFYTLWKHQKTSISIPRKNVRKPWFSDVFSGYRNKSSLMFSGGIEVEHWLEMGTQLS